MIKLFVENLAWTFNDSKFGEMCWKLYESLRRRELRNAYRRAKRR